MVEFNRGFDQKEDDGGVKKSDQTNAKSDQLMLQLPTNNDDDDENLSQTLLRLHFHRLVTMFLRKSCLSSRICVKSQGSCFVFTFCSGILQDLGRLTKRSSFAAALDSRYDAIFASLTDEFCQWIMSRLLMARRGQISWLGSMAVTDAAAAAGLAPPPKSEGCKWCKSDVLKTLSLCCWALVSQTLALIQSEDRAPFPENFASLKKCINCLHHLWALDGVSYIASLGENPAVQRRYIWAFKEIGTNVKPHLNLNSTEAGYLLDLSVECDLSGDHESGKGKH